MGISIQNVFRELGFIRVDRKTKRPDESGNGIALLLDNSGLDVFDLDSSDSDRLFYSSLIKTTKAPLIVVSPNGYHLYVRPPKDSMFLLGNRRITTKTDFRVNGYMIIPPTTGYSYMSNASFEDIEEYSDDEIRDIFDFLRKNI